MSERVKIGIVPFSGAVNVGSQYRSATWMDGEGLSPLNAANFDNNVPRFSVFDTLGVSWKGCVEARPAPYDTDDTPARDDEPATKFVPMFAPDEPDSANSGGDNYSNNYLPDDGDQDCGDAPDHGNANPVIAKEGRQAPQSSRVGGHRRAAHIAAALRQQQNDSQQSAGNQ